MSSHSIEGLIHEGAFTPDPVHLDDYLPEAVSLRSVIADVCARLWSVEAPPVGAFIRGAHRADLARSLARLPLESGESLEDWIRRAFSDEDYCIRLGQVTSLDDRLASSLHARLIQPLTSLLGPSQSGFEAVCYLGKYEQTPYGIHAEDERTFLLHLGPAPKEVWIWPRATFSALGGAREWENSFSFEPIRDSARTYRLEPTDLLFIPAGDYHILRSRSFSITLSVALHPATPTSILARALCEMIPEQAQEMDASLISYERIGTELERLLPSDSLDAEKRTVRLPLAHAIECVAARLRSNGYLLPAPPLREPSSNVSSVVKSSCRQGWPIIGVRTGGHYTVFARGHSFRFVFHPAVEKVVALINELDAFMLERIAGCLGEGYDSDTVKEFLAWLDSVRAIERIDGK